MDAAGVESAQDTLKSHSEVIKSMVRGRGALMGGVTDAQMEGFIDGASRMDASTLRIIINILLYLGSWVKPLTEWYKYADKVTLGLAAYLLGALALGIFYLWCSMTYYVFAWIYRLIFASSIAAAATKAASNSYTASTSTSTTAAAATPSLFSTAAAAVTTLLGLKAKEVVQQAATTFASPGSEQQTQAGSDLEDF
jgi:hypothetical protein